MQPWKTLTRTTILDHNKFLKIENHAIQLPDGTVIPDWSWVVVPDYINVLAVTTQEQFIIIRQLKYGIDGVTLAPVGGYIEPDEAPLAAAQRELREETGHEAPDWTDLGSYVVDSNRGAGVAYLFLAQGAVQVAEPDADDLEEQELLYLNRPQIEAALATRQFKALSWVAVVTLALQHL